MAKDRMQKGEVRDVTTSLDYSLAYSHWIYKQRQWLFN